MSAISFSIRLHPAVAGCGEHPGCRVREDRSPVKCPKNFIRPRRPCQGRAWASAQAGDAVTAANYLEYLKSCLKPSATKTLEEGGDIPADIGIVRHQKPRMSLAQRPGAAPQDGTAPPQEASRVEYGDYATDIDLDRCLDCVARQKPLKEPPAFDAFGALGRCPTPENRLFGNEAGEPANFTDFSLRERAGDPEATLGPRLRERVRLMNRMAFTEGNSSAAQCWRIRQGAKGRDASFLVALNPAARLMNAGRDVNFALPWNRPHSGDCRLDDLFSWIEKVK